MATRPVPPPPETIEVETTTVACDGGELGHPRVFLNMGREGRVECPYCDRLFVLKNGVRPRDAH
ncbi:MAG TPA: zinc-finger domain-containing protein [Alphaproteobacteria bacterium]|nr:zinc-finger domain-containing protein [Alphaproteobacteria bacterium]